MPRILFCTQSDLVEDELDSFECGFVEALKTNGNDVLVLLAREFNQAKFGQTATSDYLFNEIRKFNPSLVISLDNAGMFDSVLRAIQVPIYLWFVEGLANASVYKQVFRNKDRFKYLIASRAFARDLHDGSLVSRDNISYLPLCTDFTPTDIDQEQNISFVGSYLSTDLLIKKLRSLSADPVLSLRFRKLFDDLLARPEAGPRKLLEEHDLWCLFDDGQTEADFLNLINLNSRIKTLDGLSNLGLAIHGNSEWKNVICYSVSLFRSFKTEQPRKRACLQRIYNSSRINISLENPLARGAVSSQVFDILATSGALVTDVTEQSDLLELMGNKIRIPTFSSAAEAHEQCNYLLKNPDAREEFILAANSLINEKHRFAHRLSDLAQLSGIELFSNSSGSIRYLDPPLDKPTGDEPVFVLMHKIPMKTQLKFQVFQSASRRFQKDNCVTFEQPVQYGQVFTFLVSLQFAKKYIRIDLGDNFSCFQDLKVTVKSVNSEKSVFKLRQVNQTVTIDRVTAVGKDPFFVYENTLSEENVQILVTALYMGGI